MATLMTMPLLITDVITGYSPGFIASAKPHGRFNSLRDADREKKATKSGSKSAGGRSRRARCDAGRKRRALCSFLLFIYSFTYSFPVCNCYCCHRALAPRASPLAPRARASLFSLRFIYSEATTYGLSLRLTPELFMSVAPA